MSRLTCTVIVPTFNRARFIGEALDSILGQTRRPDQVIVVNDGSTDGTLSVLDAYSSRIEVVSKPNGGKAAAINTAMPLAGGDCVWIFDDDDVALPDALQRHLEALEEDVEADFT
jgi:glycosyltransferase involved in cell wall biosynthesis